MDLTALYTNIWRNINRKSRIRILFKDIELVEEEHQSIPEEMEEGKYALVLGQLLIKVNIFI